MKTTINPLERAADILSAVKTGVLLTTKADGKANTMTISWGTLGIEWARPIFTTFVRQSRHTLSLLERNPEFTINIPVGAFDKRILGLCGTKSGRDTDKFALCGLTPVEPEVVSVPAIREFPLTLECRVVYSQKQDLAALEGAYRGQFYPADVPGDFHGANRDAHTAFYGEIVAAYILE